VQSAVCPAVTPASPPVFLFAAILLCFLSSGLLKKPLKAFSTKN